MTNRSILVLGDVEMGAGGLADDFPHDDLLAEIITDHAATSSGERADLVFNGDTLDFMRTPFRGAFPAHTTAQVALEKLENIAAAHEAAFAAMREFIEPGDNAIHWVVGNHDFELLFPEVRARIRQLCGGSERVGFPGFELRFGPVHIEHGSQLDRMFYVDPAAPFIGADSERILNLPWGTLALMNIWGLLKQELFALDRIRPRRRLFELLPDARSLMLRQSWDYFSHEFLRDFRSDPLKRVTWDMVKEVIYRFRSADADVRLEPRYRQLLAESPARLLVLGHEHRAARYTLGTKTLLTAGCLRNEYRVADDEFTPRPLPKGGVGIRMSDDRIAHAELLTFQAPLPPPGHVPDDVRDLRPMVKRHLDALTGAEPPTD